MWADEVVEVKMFSEREMWNLLPHNTKEVIENFYEGFVTGINWMLKHRPSGPRIHKSYSLDPPTEFDTNLINQSIAENHAWVSGWELGRQQQIEGKREQR